MERPRQAVIFAGGRGTRLGSLTADRPKPMVDVDGRPFLCRQIELLRDQGFTRILLLLGYLPNTVIDHFGDGSAHGVGITYSITDVDDLTAHRVQVARELLDDTFFLAYCDNYLPFSFDRMWSQYLDAGLPVQVTGYDNVDGYSKSGMRIANRKVEIFDRSRTAEGLNAVEISYAIVHRDTALALLPEDRQELFEQAVYPPLAAAGRLGGYLTGHRYYSCGDEKKLAAARAFFTQGPTVILDRDGTLNERPPQAQYVTTPEEFRWLPGAQEALGRFGMAGYRILVVSNQAGVNRGALTADDLHRVTAKLLIGASEAGGPIERVYHCPHDWEEGCACRKPEPGMLYQAQREFDLDLTKTMFIGDDVRDGQAAFAADCPFGFVTDERSLLDITREVLEPSGLSLTSINGD